MSNMVPMMIFLSDGRVENTEEIRESVIAKNQRLQIPIFSIAFGKEADFAMDEVECSGSETSILQCSHKIDFGDYTFYNVAGVDCY